FQSHHVPLSIRRGLKMARLALVVLCIGAIGAAVVDDSIALGAESVDDYQTATLDNEYFSDAPCLSQRWSERDAPLGIGAGTVAILSERSSMPAPAAGLGAPAGLTCLMSMLC